MLAAAGLLFVALATQFVFYFFADNPTPVGDEAVEIEMRVVKGLWKWEPDVITAPAGALVRVTITNEDGFTHGFAIKELGLDKRLPGGQTTVVEFVADLTPGEYEFFCSVFCGVGHFNQRGRLVVTESLNGVDFGQPIADADKFENLPIRSQADAIERLPFTEDADGVKEFHLTADEVMWDYGDGKPIYSWGYNGQLPGPEIRVTEGDQIRVIVTNNLPEATTVHWHGIDLNWEADGVPNLTQAPIAPGETYVYEFTAKPAGTRIYHTHGFSHGSEGNQLDMGLAGAFIVEPVDFVDRPDNDITFVLTERIQNGLFAISGAIHPMVPKIMVREGERTRIRFINAGSSAIHPMHLHGHQFKVVAADGNPVPEGAQLTRNTQPVLPGETYDVEFIADNPGQWLLHCHELNHAAGGMIAEVLYEGFEPPVVYETPDHHHDHSAHQH